MAPAPDVSMTGVETPVPRNLSPSLCRSGRGEPRPGVLSPHRNFWWQRWDVDALSRRPCSGKACVCATLEGKVQVSVVVQTVDEQVRVCIMKGAHGVSDIEDSEDDVHEVSLWDTEGMKKAQMEDTAIGLVYKFLLGS